MSSGARSRSVPLVRIELADGRRIQGFVDEGYGSVVDTFRANFLERRDLGAACSVYVAGRLVVDLWGGLADRRTQRQWAAETAAVIFPCSKGLLAICTYLLAQDGRLNLDAPIASYWPEFGQKGKLVEKSIDEWDLLARRQYALDGSFVGELSDPFPIRVDP